MICPNCRVELIRRKEETELWIFYECPYCHHSETVLKNSIESFINKSGD